MTLLENILQNDGPGTQLWKLFKQLGIEPKEDCPCLILAEIMNDLGAEGCRYNHEKILKLLRKNAKMYGWKDYVRAGKNAIVLGWAFKINPLDPLPDLLGRAIKLAEEQQRCQLLGPTGS